MDTDQKFHPGEHWELVGDIAVRGRLSISDTSYFYDHPIIVEVIPEHYSVRVRYVSSEGHNYIAGVRVAHHGSLARATWMGNVTVDFAQIGICDRDAAEFAFNLLGDGGMPYYYKQLDTVGSVEWVQLPGSVKMLVIRPGFGDGSYPVYQLLRSDGTKAGIEIDCLHPLH
ncbi:MAG TPA: hypothetical protein VJ063_15565 [Verrucomicrobiae bacterium]|nr:hypothetical protein [Verrucomicrobiae bacterium]